MLSSTKSGFKLMTNPNSSSRVVCSVYGCDMRSGTNAFSEVKMFTFPRDPYRKRRWELSIGRGDSWKSHSRARICSKHFITGKPSKIPTNPDYVPSVFDFNKNEQNLKRNVKSKPRKRTRATDSCSDPTCRNNSSRKGNDMTLSCGIKGFCGKCFSAESVTSAFSHSLEPLNQTLTQMMLKLTDMEEEREQLRNELALCRGEIHELREAHQDCMTPSPPTRSLLKPVSSVSVPSTSSLDVANVFQSTSSDEPTDIYDPDLLPSQYLEQIFHQPDDASEGKRQPKRKQSNETHSDVVSILNQSQRPKKKRMKNARLESEGLAEFCPEDEVEIPFQNGLYLCLYCDQTRPFRSHMKIHLRKHTKERPFKCLLCYKGFSTKDNLKIHLKTHTGGTDI